MTSCTIDIRTLPPRPLRPDERALLREWVSVAGDIATAYFSERRGDDPAMFRKIVIYEDEFDGPSYLIHVTEPVDAWVTFDLRRPSDGLCFISLREALNSVRPVLRSRFAESAMIEAEALF